MAAKRSKHTGIEVRHSDRCATSHGGEKCTCSPKYRAEVFDPREKRKLRETFKTLAEAKAWRSDALWAMRRGTLSAALAPTLAEASETWVAGARSGAIRNRSGDPYKPCVIRGYEQAMRLRVLPVLGKQRLNDIRRRDLQDLVDAMLGDAHHPSTIRNTLLPVRVIYRRALVRGDVVVKPTIGLELPAVRGTRVERSGPQPCTPASASASSSRSSGTRWTSRFLGAGTATVKLFTLLDDQRLDDELGGRDAPGPRGLQGRGAARPRRSALRRRRRAPRAGGSRAHRRADLARSRRPRLGRTGAGRRHHASAHRGGRPLSIAGPSAMAVPRAASIPGHAGSDRVARRGALA